MAKTYLEDMLEKHPELDEIDVIGMCVIDLYKKDEKCDEQPGEDCPECWNQEMKEK